MLDVNGTVKKLGAKCANILAVHALSGCDTTSYPYGKGKATAVNILLKHDFEDMDRVLGNEDATQEQIMAIGRDFFLKLYGTTRVFTMNEARVSLFKKRKTPPALKNLPPTDANLMLHCLRAHHQVMLWKAASEQFPPVAAKDITKYGWYLKDGVPQPYVAQIPVAPPGLLDVVSCTCKSNQPCKTNRCSCRKQCLPCTDYCNCTGDSSCRNQWTNSGIDDVDDKVDDDRSSDEEDMDMT